MWTTTAAGRARLYLGDCRDALEEMPSNSVDAINCDPPYALVSVVKRFGKEGSAPAKHGTDGRYARASAGFMGEKWDTGEVAFAAEFWAQCLRVLKPGGHLLAMGGTRTYHRLACAIEDAGFDIRDQLAWVYGTGFPKSHDEGDGRGTALKPAWEPICLARKNLSEKTIAANLSKWGTGALWIERSRVPLIGKTDPPLGGKGKWSTSGMGKNVYGDYAGVEVGSSELGRWPANILHDGSAEVLEAFPNSKGKKGRTSGNESSTPAQHVHKSGFKRLAVEPRNDGEGSAARFFYAAKASATDRSEGTDHLPIPEGQKRTNFHPTVKPTPLMEWGNGLICPPGGVILDPFMGSGSTGKAAIRGGFHFIGVENDPKYMPIAAARLEFEASKQAPDDY